MATERNCCDTGDEDDETDYTAGVSVPVPLMAIRVREISIVVGEDLVPVTDKQHHTVTIQVRAWLSQHLERLGGQIKRVMAHTLTGDGDGDRPPCQTMNLDEPVQQSLSLSPPPPKNAAKYGKEIVVQVSRMGPVENPGMILVDSIHANRKPKWATVSVEDDKNSAATSFLCWMTMVAQDPPQPNELYVVALSVDSCVARTHPITKAVESVCRVVPIGALVHAH